MLFLALPQVTRACVPVLTARFPDADTDTAADGHAGGSGAQASR